MFILTLGFFILSCFFLVKSSEYLAKSLIKISSFFRVNEFAVGFIILSVSSSLPHLFVGIASSLGNQPLFSMGNVIGSNILDLTLIIGIITLLARNIKIKSKMIKKDLVYMLIILLLPVFLMVDHKFFSLVGISGIEPGISRIDGFVLLAVFCLYIWSLFGQERLFRRTMHPNGTKSIFKNLIVFFISFFILILSSSFVVDYAKMISIDLAITPLLMGLFIISIGTSLPELIMQARAILAKKDELAVGDLIGSVVTNSTLVLGITAIISPITGTALIFVTSLSFMAITAFIFITFAESGSGLSWKEGISLILLYLFFLIVEIYIQSI
ncbi:MAG: hypothetical protein V1859_00540 [archaeon]